ncbi:MAG TPA: hypothetical protein VJY39_02850 [Acidisphaera sp.]|nr:hypothetical protein [Acidisphaera sp.]
MDWRNQMEGRALPPINGRFADDFRPVVAAAALMLGVSVPGLAHADPASDCQAAGGSYMTGAVVSGPQFWRGHPLRGVELSHTHIRVRSDGDQRVYDVAMDDVFAGGYDAAGDSVPAPLSQIQVGDHVELCGQLYPDGTGIHFVHTNCGDPPMASDPDGWVKEIAADGARGPNLEASTEYCSLWQRH